MEVTGRLTALLLAVYGSLFLGFLSRRALVRPTRASGVLSRLFLLVTSPLVILNSLWSVRIPDLHTAALPLIQVCLQFLSLIPALLAARALNTDRSEKGAVISCSMFSNTGPTLGMVICYVLFGDRGMYLAGWFIVLFSPVYYLIAFPLLSLFSPLGIPGRYSADRNPKARGSRDPRHVGRRTGGLRQAVADLVSNPVSAVPMAFTLLGIGLNLSGLPRPLPLNLVVNRYLSFLSAGGFSLAIGMGLDFRRSLGYFRHALVVSAVKFLFTPLAACGMLLALGFFRHPDPLPAQVALVESVMPTAILAVVAVKLFGLNEDLANAVWILSTLLGGPVILLLFVLQRLFW